MVPHSRDTEVAAKQICTGTVLVQSLVDKENFGHTWPKPGTGAWSFGGYGRSCEESAQSPGSSFLFAHLSEGGIQTRG